MPRFPFRSLGLILAFCVPSFGVECAPADLILNNGHIITMDYERGIVSALAVRNGRIEAVGTNQSIAGCAGPATRKIDLKGRTVLPGFIDVHTHALAWAGGMVSDEVDATYPKVHTIAEIKSAVAQHAKSAAAGDWSSTAI